MGPPASQTRFLDSGGGVLRKPCRLMPGVYFLAELVAAAIGFWPRGDESIESSDHLANSVGQKSRVLFAGLA